jgi:glycerophosphoryl diester phosphodiesterase
VSLILAHRGASGYQPEMTKSAYELALTMGVDGLEADVRLTKDDVLVAIHDRNTKRVADKNLNISNSTYSQLLDLNFFGEQKYDGAFKILKLTELIDLALATKKPLTLAIEAKHPSIKSFLLEKKIVQTLNDYKIANGKIEQLQIILMSFNLFAVKTFKKLLPDTPAVMLVEKNYPFLANVSTPGGAEYVGPGIELLNKNPKLYKKWRKKGKKFFIWTVDHPKDVKWCLEKGVEIFVSNYPDLSLKLRRESL